MPEPPDGHRTPRPSRPDRRRYRTDLRVLYAGLGDGSHEFWRRAHGTALWPAKDQPASSRSDPWSGGRSADPRLRRSVLYHRRAAGRGHRAFGQMRGADRRRTRTARRRYRDDPVGLYPRPRPEPDRDLELLTISRRARTVGRYL